MIELEDFFSTATKAVDERMNQTIPSADVAPQRLYAAIRWSLLGGGKRFRPGLVLAVGETFGAKRENLLTTATAIEMIHTYSLIHDDLPAMDDDDLRRGRLTCHKKFDEATAILAGDVLQTLAFQTIAEDENLSEKTRVRLIAEFSRAAAEMVAGQQMDLEAEGKSIGVSKLESIHRRKTGAIISAAARSGAIIADADDQEFNAVTVYAENLGLLFQITDDLLDVTQTSEILGKTAGKDERAAKATYVSLYGLEKARELAHTTFSESCRALDNIKKGTTRLRAIADFILNRKK